MEAEQNVLRLASYNAETGKSPLKFDRSDSAVCLGLRLRERRGGGVLCPLSVTIGRGHEQGDNMVLQSAECSQVTSRD